MNTKDTKEQKNRAVSNKDAEASAPENYSVVGEEDPGVALEQWINEQKKAKEKAKTIKPDGSEN